MRHIAKTLLVPCALALSACTAVTPAFKDIGTRSGPCVDGGPDSVAQQFYDYRIQHRGQNAGDVSALRPYLSDSLWQTLQKANQSHPEQAVFLKGDIFSSRATTPDSVAVASSSRIPNTDARNIPLRIEQSQGDQRWVDEVLMIREGQCWVVDDVRYLGGVAHAPAGTLRQSLEKRGS